MEKKKRKLSVPHTYVIIGIILVIVPLMTYVIPAGQYDRVMDEASGQEIIVTGSYHHVEQTLWVRSRWLRLWQKEWSMLLISFSSVSSLTALST